ncbi:hypothetical protein U9M48_005475 [Paspalum notatum var. saurae]|uniref:Uncharacterized protein n=1 Tax=Paspalum notatum var. saurae TaxID=547442 RepID=A0AAQ3PMH8_PASNO
MNYDRQNFRCEILFELFLRMKLC